jgi:parallel beta-helix repeat protein
MNKRLRIASAGLALLLAITAIPALAAEGRIPVWRPITISPGGEGMYILTRDITASGAPAIDIQAGTVAVDIDLNGFTIYGAAGFNVIRAVGVDSLTIRNGTIMGGGGDGIQAWECRKVVVEDVKIQFSDTHGIALYQVPNFAIRRNIIHAAQHGDGIIADGTTIDPYIYVEGTIEDNLIRECGGGIAIFMGSSIAIINNRIEATTSADGIFISAGAQQDMPGCLACLIAENTIQEAAANGMWLSWFQNGKVYNNVVTWSGGEGIWLDQASDNNLVLDNVAGQNGSNGMLVDSNNNHLERNVLSQNGFAAGAGFGLYIRNGVSNTYRGNTGRANPGGPCIGFPATTDICDDPAASTSPITDNVMPFPL